MHEHTLILLDWDDTLFPTSWVMNNKIDLSDKYTKDTYQILFAELDNMLYQFLIKCMSLGTVIIVTNASYGWIKISGDLVPNTMRMIQKNIKVLSAREIYKNITVMNKWKHLAFEDEVENHFKDNTHMHNIVSIGDAKYEFNALISFYDWNKIVPKKRILKTVRFIKAPTYYTLIDQIGVLIGHIESICTKKKHVDLLFKNIG